MLPAHIHIQNGVISTPPVNGGFVCTTTMYVDQELSMPDMAMNSIWVVCANTVFASLIDIAPPWFGAHGRPAYDVFTIHRHILADVAALK